MSKEIYTVAKGIYTPVEIGATCIICDTFIPVNEFYIPLICLECKKRLKDLLYNDKES